MTQFVNVDLQPRYNIAPSQIVEAIIRDAVRSVSKEIIETCVKAGISKVLVDVREMTGHLSLPEDYQVPARDFHALEHGGLLASSRQQQTLPRSARPSKLSRQHCTVTLTATGANSREPPNADPQQARLQLSERCDHAATAPPR